MIQDTYKSAPQRANARGPAPGNEVLMHSQTTVRDPDFDYSVGRLPWGNGGITATSAPRPEPFTWGTVLCVHSVGEYAIVEYEPRPPFNGEGRSSRCFHPFIGGKDTHHSYGSLDAALAGCIALKYDGVNTKADRYFLRGIGA